MSYDNRLRGMIREVMEEFEKAKASKVFRPFVSALRLVRLRYKLTDNEYTELKAKLSRLGHEGRKHLRHRRIGQMVKTTTDFAPVQGDLQLITSQADDTCRSFVKQKREYGYHRRRVRIA